MNPGPRREIFKYFVLSPELSELNGHLLHEGYVIRNYTVHAGKKGALWLGKQRKKNIIVAYLC